ncbi:MAG: hypothetical protein IJ826_06320 [Bacteroidaceae bacterium]|nr:hypothetical protein [Bacteroidaceae bacterium]
MKQSNINGFNESQIFQLYAYVVAYEDSGIVRYESTKAMLKEHPELSEVEKVVRMVRLRNAKYETMKDVDFKTLQNEVYHTKSKGNMLLSFLAHLRNSIAHGGAVEYQGSVLITDFEPPKYHPVYFTARGCVTFSTINDITKILKNIIL